MVRSSKDSASESVVQSTPAIRQFSAPRTVIQNEYVAYFPSFVAYFVLIRSGPSEFSSPRARPAATQSPVAPKARGVDSEAVRGSRKGNLSPSNGSRKGRASRLLHTSSFN